jgi:hypothetical protein
MNEIATAVSKNCTSEAIARPAVFCYLTQVLVVVLISLKKD